MRRAFTCLAFVLLGALPARAEIVFFANGRYLSVKSHRPDGDAIVLTLRSGGEMTVSSSTIERIEPDEVPYLEPEDAAAKPDAASDVDVDVAGGRYVRLQPDPRYDPIIERVSREQGVDATLVRAVIQVESAYQARARSRKGAMGLMQLMPQTARRYAVTNPYDPASNIEAGIKHLKGLLERLPVDMALAAYNAGEAAVEKFRGIPPYPETRQYVASILRLINDMTRGSLPRTTQGR